VPVAKIGQQLVVFNGEAVYLHEADQASAVVP
jgi:hypothetical protein